MLKQSIFPLFVPWGHVHREHAALQIYTPLLPLVEACTNIPSWSVRDAYICNTAFGINSSYTALGINSSLIQVDIGTDICGASNAPNNDNAPSQFPLHWEDRPEGSRRPANDRWDMSPRIINAVFRGNESWHDVSIQGDWMQVEKTLECIKRVDAVDSKAKTLSVLVEQPWSSHCPNEYINYPVPTFDDVKSTTDALLSTMGRLSNLRTLRMQVLDIHTDWFDMSVSTNHTSANTTTNGITSLILGAFTHGLIAHTPHLTNVSLDGEWFWPSQVPQDALVAALEHSASAVEHLELKMINEVILARAARAIPGLKTLELQDAAMEPWRYKLELKDLIPGLSLFTNVTSLSLPPVHALDSSYSPPWCGNASINDLGFLEVPNRQSDIAPARLLETVKTGLPLVERVRFGGGDWYGIR